MNQTKRNSLVIMLAVFAVACTRSPTTEKQATHDLNEPAPPMVTDKSENLLLSWFEDGAPKTSFLIDDVPQELRKDVRVQDVTVPPDRRNPRYVFLADLTRPSSEGTYPVRTLEREGWESLRHKPNASAPIEQQAIAQTAIGGGNSGSPSIPVVMYSTNYCPVCKTARRWLLENKIPYVEKDLQADRAAAEELARKGRAQGVSTSGVPIFEVHGQLVPGFDPATILGLLRPRGPGGKTTQI